MSNARTALRRAATYNSRLLLSLSPSTSKDTHTRRCIFESSLMQSIRPRGERNTVHRTGIVEREFVFSISSPIIFRMRIQVYARDGGCHWRFESTESCQGTVDTLVLTLVVLLNKCYSIDLVAFGVGPDIASQPMRKKILSIDSFQKISLTRHSGWRNHVHTLLGTRCAFHLEVGEVHLMQRPGAAEAVHSATCLMVI